MASENCTPGKMLKIISKHFLGQYNWCTFLKAKNIDWCIANTVQIVREATYLKKLFFEQISSEKIKKKIIKRLMRKCRVWILYFKQYGHQDIRTLKYFKKLIQYIVKNKDSDAYDDAYESHDPDDYEDDDPQQEFEDETEDETDDEVYDKQSSDDNHCKPTSSGGGFHLLQPSLGWVNSTNKSTKEEKAEKAKEEDIDVEQEKDRNEKPFDVVVVNDVETVKGERENKVAICRRNNDFPVAGISKNSISPIRDSFCISENVDHSKRQIEREKERTTENEKVETIGVKKVADKGLEKEPPDNGKVPGESNYDKDKVADEETGLGENAPDKKVAIAVKHDAHEVENYVLENMEKILENDSLVEKVYEKDVEDVAEPDSERVNKNDCDNNSLVEKVFMDSEKHINANVFEIESSCLWRQTVWADRQSVPDRRDLGKYKYWDPGIWRLII